MTRYQQQMEALRQRERDRYNPRPSNARNRCACCKVEISCGAVNCARCGARKSRGRG